MSTADAGRASSTLRSFDEVLAVLPDEDESLETKAAASWTPALPRGRRRTGPLRIGCATSSPAGASRSRTRATASAGAAHSSPFVAERPDRPKRPGRSKDAGSGGPGRRPPGGARGGGSRGGPPSDSREGRRAVVPTAAMTEPRGAARDPAARDRLGAGSASREEAVIRKASAALATPEMRPGRGTGTAAIAPPVHRAGSSVAPTTRSPEMVGRPRDVEIVRGGRDLAHRAGLVRVGLVVPVPGHAVRQVMGGRQETRRPDDRRPGGDRSGRFPSPPDEASERWERPRPPGPAGRPERGGGPPKPRTGSFDRFSRGGPRPAAVPSRPGGPPRPGGGQRFGTGPRPNRFGPGTSRGPVPETRGRGTRRGTPSSGGRRRRSSSWSPRTRSSWRADGPSRRRSSRDGRPDGCSSSRSDGRPSSGSSCTRRACESRSWRSRAGR